MVRHRDHIEVIEHAVKHGQLRRMSYVATCWCCSRHWTGYSRVDVDRQVDTFLASAEAAE